ncbi:MAG: hypothetical protein U1F98_00790 [Verrucomicrobiota bacterium]
MIHALPGMGADRRMFPRPWESLPSFAAHNWPPYRGERDLPALARQVVEHFGIQDQDTVIGASLGGMVACEIARIRNLRALFLVGSATHRQEINRFFSLLHPLAAVTPWKTLRRAARHLPHDFTLMFADSDTDFVRAMCHAVFQWKGLHSSSTPCYRLHGRKDRIIPCPPAPDLALEGGHLISMTHAAECAAFIANQLS